MCDLALIIVALLGCIQVKEAKGRTRKKGIERTPRSSHLPLHPLT